MTAVLPPVPVATRPAPTLTDEQQELLDAVARGEDVIVDSTIGSGKTTAIQALCAAQPVDRSILYLTYSKMLKADAQGRVGNAKVQNFHGIVYPHLLRLGIRAGLGESVEVFNRHFDDISAGFESYDLLVVDEYQDLNTEYAKLLENIKSINPLMQVVMVGDVDQKVRSDTTLDAQAFAKNFCANPVMLGFTRSFRMGPDMAELLGKAWNKQITGVNPNQKVSVVTHDEAIDLIAHTEPGDILCLGKRNGAMMHALNKAEEQAPQRYHKGSVFASIRDGDSDVRPDEGTAVFTTFDACKGMERKVCVIFDYSPQTWSMRGKFPNADPVVLRNVFLVAASRGKEHIVFVASGDMRKIDVHQGCAPKSMPMIGFLPVKSFIELAAKTRPVYGLPLPVSTAFSFKYAEDIAACMQLLRRHQVRGPGVEIDIVRRDGLIDLSPAVGRYQEALFFDDYDPVRQLIKISDAVPTADMYIPDMGEISEDPWRSSVLLVAAETEQQRYVRQVKIKPSSTQAQLLEDRLASELHRDCHSQVGLGLSGQAHAGRGVYSQLDFTGIADAIDNNRLYELKFTSSLDHEAFLQAAMYLVMARTHGFELECAVLWNTRTDEQWEVEVTDPPRFLHAVARCVSKGSYTSYSLD